MDVILILLSKAQLCQKINWGQNMEARPASAVYDHVPFHLFCVCVCKFKVRHSTPSRSTSEASVFSQFIWTGQVGVSTFCRCKRVAGDGACQGSFADRSPRSASFSLPPSAVKLDEHVITCDEQVSFVDLPSEFGAFCSHVDLFLAQDRSHPFVR